MNYSTEQLDNAKVTADNTTTVIKRKESNDTVVEAKITISDMLGTWSGIFDGKSSKLKITEQNDTNFAGKIIINYGQVTHQEIKGILNQSTGKITMTDQLKVVTSESIKENYQQTIIISPEL